MKRIKKITAVAMAGMMTVALLSGCTPQEGKQESDAITVYLWSAELMLEYAPYIQSQLPDVEIEFIVGNNDLDFYQFLGENGELPDIITNRRFSLHDAQSLRDQLMDLSYTQEAGSIYLEYLDNYTYNDGTVNWLPLCAEADGLIANQALFDKYGIPLPTDYESFVSACKAFEKVGIRGFVSDFAYDYTCLEILQGLSIPELTSMEGQSWRHHYEDVADEENGLDDEIWPGVFERMEQFIADAGITAEDVTLGYNQVQRMFAEGEVAMTRDTGTQVISQVNPGVVEPVLLPYFGQNGEEWLLTYPTFQVALNKDLEKDEERKEKAFQILEVMFSSEGQNILAQKKDVLPYSKNVELELSGRFDNLKPYIDENHLYVRLASNDFFEVSRDVVHKMIQGEYDARQAYEAFDTQLREAGEEDTEIVRTIEQGYSNQFQSNGGNQSASVMANTLRTMYGSDVLVAPSYSFTGSVMEADYTEKMVGYMIMPNSLLSWQRDMTGKELREYLRISVEGVEGGFTPFNKGSLPIVSGATIEVKETDGKYTLDRVLIDGEEIRDEDVYQVTGLNSPAYLEPLAQHLYPDQGIEAFEQGESRVRDAWTEYMKAGGSIAEPTGYITLE